MQLTNADVDQWLSDLSAIVPVGRSGTRELNSHTLDLVRALALEAHDPDYVIRAARIVFPR